jgi:anti-anti-sigma factor
VKKSFFHNNLKSISLSHLKEQPMTADIFSANVRKSGENVIIDLQGPMDSQADDALSKAYREADTFHPDMIWLNFSAVNYINSTGIALIVDLLAQARKIHRRVGVFGLSEHYLQIFRLTRLSDFMEVYQNEPSVLLN